MKVLWSSDNQGGRGGGRGGRGGKQDGAERKKRESILNLAQYVDQSIRVKFLGGREGASAGGLRLQALPLGVVKLSPKGGKL